MTGTGVCGISCHACGLFHQGKCSSCGSGTSIEARAKLAAQERLGFRCPVLACAVAREMEYCSRDCPEFPCPLYERGPYPLSAAYLQMYKRRRSARQKNPINH